MDTSIASANPRAFNRAFSISPHALNLRLGRPDAPLVLDVRREEKFALSPCVIATAQRCKPDHVAAWAASQRPREVVVHCVYGHHVSADAVTLLRAAGWSACRLDGGIEGGQDGVDTPQHIAQWRAQPAFTLRKRPDWGVTGEYASRWITRERPKVDRMACPWLITRFIDPRAQFFYVPMPQVFAEAQRLDAVAYDIPGAPVSHVGDLCSFDALLGGFELNHPALDLLARIVRGADTDRLDLAAQSAGLLAISLGLSRLHADDHTMLQAAMPLYDALYAWCCDKVAAQDTSHSWKPQ